MESFWSKHGGDSLKRSSATPLDSCCPSESSVCVLKTVCLEKCEKIMVMMMMILLKEEEEKKPPCFSPLYRQNGENASRAD